MDTPSESKNIKCNVCDKNFISNWHLIRHMRTHTGEKPYKCSFCEEAFSDISNATRHTLLHTGEKPFICSVCDEAFNSQSTLARHMLLHTGVKPFICNECEKAFNRKSHLARHMVIHTGEKPYKCNKCNNYFRFKNSLTRHKRLHTDENSEPTSLDSSEHPNWRVSISPCNIDRQVSSTSTSLEEKEITGQAFSQRPSSFDTNEDPWMNWSENNKVLEVLDFLQQIITPGNTNQQIHNEENSLKTKEEYSINISSFDVNNFPKQSESLPFQETQQESYPEARHKAVSEHLQGREGVIIGNNDLFASSSMTAQEKGIACKTCGETFQDFDLVEQDLLKHSSENSISFPICSENLFNV